MRLNAATYKTPVHAPGDNSAKTRHMRRLTTDSPRTGRVDNLEMYQGFVRVTNGDRVVLVPMANVSFVEPAPVEEKQDGKQATVAAEA